MPQTAIGLPDPTNYGTPTNLPLGELVRWVIQQHNAKKAGTHNDIRLGVDGLMSWATKKELPKPGGKPIALYQQPLHDKSYADFQGLIPEGYGAGSVRTKDSGEVQILATSPRRIKFAIAHKGEPEVFNLVRIENDNKPYWMLNNVTPNLPTTFQKTHYKRIPVEDVDSLLNDPTVTMSDKVDGALNVVRFLKDDIDVVSYRKSKEGRPISHTLRMGIRNKVNVPQGLRNMNLLGELYGEQNGKAIPAATLGGILNSTLANSLRKQQADGIKLKMALFGTYDPQTQQTKYLADPEAQETIKQALRILPKSTFRALQAVSDPDRKRKMWANISTGKDPLTQEGAVFQRPGGVPMKVKLVDDHDVLIKNVFKAITASGTPRAGGFDYALPGNPNKVVGRVGTGFDRRLAEDMFNNPDKYIGRVAKVKAQDQFSSGALRAPSFHAMHEDPEVEKGAY